MQSLIKTHCQFIKRLLCGSKRTPIYMTVWCPDTADRPDQYSILQSQHEDRVLEDNEISLKIWLQ